MGRMSFVDENNRKWVAGWNNPGQGYFAQRLNDEPSPGTCEGCPHLWEEDPACLDCPVELYDEFDVNLGFGRSLDLGVLQYRTEEFGWAMTHEQLEAMRADRARDERPLSPLQQLMWELMDRVGEEGE